MKCALCKKDVRSHKGERVLIVNSGVLDVEPATVKQLMHKRCATHYRVAERMLISAGSYQRSREERTNRRRFAEYE